MACNQRGGEREGELVYKITYLQSNADNPLIRLLPSEIVMHFKDNNTVTIVDGFWGTFQLKFITNRNLKSSCSILHILDKKYICMNDIDSLSAGYAKMSGMEIKNIKDTSNINGFLCHQAEALCKTIAEEPILIHYTYDIDIEQPNSNSPYSMIDGVLAKFQANVAGVDMLFELVEYNNIQVKDSEFSIPTDHKEISRTDFNDILLSFQ